MYGAMKGSEYFLLSLCEFLGNRKSVGQIEACCCSRHEKLLTRYKKNISGKIIRDG